MLEYREKYFLCSGIRLRLEKGKNEPRCCFLSKEAVLRGVTKALAVSQAKTTLQNRTATVTKEIENNYPSSSEYLSGILGGDEYTLHARAAGRALKLAERGKQIMLESVKYLKGTDLSYSEGSHYFFNCCQNCTDLLTNRLIPRNFKS